MCVENTTKQENACDFAVFRTSQAPQQMCLGKGESEGAVPISFGNQPSKGEGCMMASQRSNKNTHYTSTAEARAFSSIVAFIAETGVAVRISAPHTFCSPLFVFSSARHAPIPGDPFVCFFALARKGAFCARASEEERDYFEMASKDNKISETKSPVFL